ncbi:hypothetical protein OHC33_001991 [Knufia fluminis]|uniref:Uncharacterized protein n=1 Tax=Knufia fluminis TaxID=191047 RepID=A0AAN8EYD3_9EURO|nr:hypothetical protein OHC33_001991 [Knufia fluminis]
MTTSAALTEVQLPPKEANNAGTFSSSRLLSKIARSPTSSRRHRPVRSQGSDTLSDLQPAGAVQAQTALHSRRNQPRPGFQRQISAPDTFVLRQRKEEDLEPRHHSDASEETGAQARAMLARPPTANLPLHTGTSVTSKGISQASMFSAPLVSEYYVPPQVTGGPAATSYMYQQLYELSQKRIATLQYMRKAYEGKLFWFNTVHFSKRDVERFNSHMPNRLSRRATNYFLLGISIPSVLDIHQVPHPSSSAQASISTAMELLKSLHILLTEFESYQERHPTDGSHVGSLSRARLPSMFKRSGTTSRPRKSSTAPSVEIGAQISPPAVPDTPHHQLQHNHSAHPSIDATASIAATSTSTATTLVNAQNSSFTSSNGGLPMNTQHFSATATFPPPGPPDAPNSSLMLNEAPYTHLLTPPLPFAPDFYTVFATLCDVLIDTYQRLLQMVNGPSTCNATVAELFSKTDAKIRKVMVGGIIKDFESASREKAKQELAGVQKVVLGGLMG